MRRKSKTSHGMKILAVEAYECNEGSLKTIAERFCIKRNNLERCIQAYRFQGYHQWSITK